MDPKKLPIEIEVSPRFEIFYALHKTFAPASALSDKWRKSARARLGRRLEGDAEDVAPHPLMWAVLADSTLHAKRISGFDELIGSIEGQPGEDFRNTVLAGVPDIPGADLRATFERLLRSPDEYRFQLVSVLRAFWARVFADDFATIEPELKRMARQFRATSTSLNAEVGSRFGIPVSVDVNAERLTAGKSGFSIPLSSMGRVVLLPSAFNLNKWWTKRDGEQVDLFFPVSDGTITPSDAISSQPVAARTDVAVDVQPEVVFRALGDTTRYAIATILARSPATPTELSRQLKISKPTITHHVHSLRDAGLIVDGGEGGKLALDRAKLEQLSQATVSSLFSSEGRLKLSKTRKKTR